MFLSSIIFSFYNLETDKVLGTSINLHAYEQHTSFGRIQKMLKLNQYILHNDISCLVDQLIAWKSSRHECLVLQICLTDFLKSSSCLFVGCGSSLPLSMSSRFQFTMFLLWMNVLEVEHHICIGGYFIHFLIGQSAS